MWHLVVAVIWGLPPTGSITLAEKGVYETKSQCQTVMMEWAIEAEKLRGRNARYGLPGHFYYDCLDPDQYEQFKQTIHPYARRFIPNVER